jgi:hypothetical protein
MRFLDLDLDFFLNKNAYKSALNSGRLGPEYKPWSFRRVRHFMEDRCGLSSDAPVQGRIVESHDGVLQFWRTLIESGRLKIPFEVIHIDAHPDIWGGGLYLVSGFLHIDPEYGQVMLKKKNIHSGNYLTFAIAYGWLSSLVWIPLEKHPGSPPEWDADARSILKHINNRKSENSSVPGSPITEREPGIPYRILPQDKFRMREKFDYMALSLSPIFTPPESDKLISVIEGYMRTL